MSRHSELDDAAVVGETVAGLRELYASGRTRPLAWRLKQLEAALRMLKDNEPSWVAAIASGERKPAAEATTTEVLVCLLELQTMVKKLASWTAAKHVGTPLPLIHSIMPVIMKDFAGDHASSFAFFSLSSVWLVLRAAILSSCAGRGTSAGQGARRGRRRHGEQGASTQERASALDGAHPLVASMDLRVAGRLGHVAVAGAGGLRHVHRPLQTRARRHADACGCR